MAKKTVEVVVVEEKKPTYVAKFRVYHPYQAKYIDTDPVELDLDSWLQCQIDAGIVSEC